MVTIQDKIKNLGSLLAKEQVSFDMAQRVQFDWLASIQAQLDYYRTDQSFDQEEEQEKHASFEAPHTSPLVNKNSVHLEDESVGTEDLLPIATLTTLAEDRAKQEPKKTNFSILAPEEDNAEDRDNSLGRSATMPVFAIQPDIGLSAGNSSIRFVDDESLLIDESSDSGDEGPIPFTVSGSMRELTQSAASFREKWREMLQVKKAATNLPKKQAVFAFEEDEGIPDGYKISDDDDMSDEDDDIYEANPVEIHGKMIPIWARGDQLLKILRKQKRIDPDSIFAGYSMDCSLPEIFNTQKPRWEQRNDSGWWDSDRVTEEEVAQFKAALGLD